MIRSLLVALAIATQGPDITGEYACTGTGADNASYSVSLEVERDGDTYALTWATPQGTTGVGIGLLKNGVLSVIFQTPNGIGLASYAVGKGQLDGTWTVPGSDESYPELCTVGGPTQVA